MMDALECEEGSDVILASRAFRISTRPSVRPTHSRTVSPATSSLNSVAMRFQSSQIVVPITTASAPTIFSKLLTWASSVSSNLRFTPGSLQVHSFSRFTEFQPAHLHHDRLPFMDSKSNWITPKTLPGLLDHPSETPVKQVHRNWFYSIYSQPLGVPVKDSFKVN